MQNPNFFTPNFFWLSEVRCLQNKWNILSSWVLKYVSESIDAKKTSEEQKVNGIIIYKCQCGTYNPIFSCRSFFELHEVFESFKCIPLRYLRPTSLSNWFTIEMIWYLLPVNKFEKSLRTCQTEDKTLSHLRSMNKSEPTSSLPSS